MTQHPNFFFEAPEADPASPGFGVFVPRSFSFMLLLGFSPLAAIDCCPRPELTAAVPFLAASRAATTRRTSTVIACQKGNRITWDGFETACDVVDM